jgi:hypothetical protein
MKIIGIFLILTSCFSWAKERPSTTHASPKALPGEIKFKKKVDPGALQRELTNAGFSIDYIQCVNDYCTIHLGQNEKKDPMTVVNKYIYVDPVANRLKKMAAVQALYAKWEAGTISAEEKDLLIKEFIGVVLGK